MNTCETYAALLDLFVDGELSLEEMLEVQAHLDECPACRAYVDDALAMQASFPDAEETEVPESFAAGVMAKIQADIAARPASPHKRKKTPWVGVLASLAACCAIVIIQQNGPLAARGESAAASMAYETAVAEEAACDDAAPEHYYTADSATEETAEESMVEAEEAAPMERQTEAPAEGSAVAQSVKNTAVEDDSATAPVAMDLTSVDSWVEHENVVFACVVYLSPDWVGDALDGYEGKPFSNARLPEEGIIGTGYALDQEEFERILYDEFDYLHGPMLNQERTTDLCCIVVTENEMFS